MTRLLSVLACASIASFAHADLNSDVLAHPVVKSIEQLMAKAYGSRCTTPKADDVKVLCFGALGDVDVPTIINNSCVFSLDIVCQRNVASITGRQGIVQIENPDGTLGQSSDLGLIISDVKVPTR